MAQSSVTIDAINNILSGDRDLTPILLVSDIRSETLIVSDSVRHHEAVFDQRLRDSSRSVSKGSHICLTEYRLVSYGSKELIRILDFHIIGEDPISALSPIPPPALSFVPISLIETATNNAIVDFIGVVAKVDPPVPSQRNTGRHSQKTSIELIDQSSGSSSIELTVWEEEFCNREVKILQHMLDSGLSPVLAVKSARVNTGSCGKSVGIRTRRATQLFINPNFPEAEYLRSWYHKGDGRDIPFQVEEQEDRGRLMMLEEKELEKSRKAEKARLQAEAKAAEEAALLNAELAAAEAKRKLDIESEALRQGLQKVDLKQILEVMTDFYENVRASDREIEQMLKTLQVFKAITEGYLSIVNGVYQECGSLITGLSTKSSDLNITVITREDPADFHRPLNVLKRIICSHSQVTNSKLSFPSRSRHAFISFDLNCVKYRVSVNGKREVLFSRILIQIQKAHHCFKQLVLMAKAWAKRQGIYKRKSWGLSAFSLYALIIFFLQSEGLFPPLWELVPDPILTKLKDECDYSSGQEDLLEHVSRYVKKNQNRLPSQEFEAEMLFVRFLEAFQGLAKDSQEKYISTREGLWMQKTQNMLRDNNLWVEDPFDAGTNLSDNTKMEHVAKISHKFESSIKIVRTGNCSTIRSMLGWDKNRCVG